MKPLRFYALGAEVRGSYDGPPGDGWVEVQVVPIDARIAGPDDIVIRRDELPEVTTGSGYSRGAWAGGRGWDDAYIASTGRAALAERAEATARKYLAVAEYLREHPPVDEAQVDDIAKALGEAQQNRPFPQQLSDRELREEARLLFQQGVRVGGDSR
ncbi:hypothetical protein JN535_08490 [Cellulosimicrobium cellulans]|uniref:hypothetical protein n=1 Tax=Cellulosimicrobium cellulans TaxID=1710 RepID=UPI001965CD43|nr:hypothetical protein [Cellulosimicrobium cellulans]MBN0040203.1 hypothetical protein [Cellulosimicrobium cellulans]